MLRRFSLGFFSLVCALAVGACSSSDTTPLSSGGVPGIGPNFPTGTLYAASSTNNAVSIYAPNPASSAAPQSQIGGSNTGLNGPQYMAFDNLTRLYVTNYNPATSQASIQIFQKFATGNVIPLLSLSGASSRLTQPRGIAIDQKSGNYIVANVNPASAFPNELLIFQNTNLGAIVPAVISGALTQLNSPTGVALDTAGQAYVANRGSGTVTEYVLPTPAPAPSGSPSPTPSPTPTPNPGTSPSPTPVPTTPPGQNLAPVQTIAGLGAPTGIAVDANNNVYVTDPDNGSPAIYVFAPGAASAGAASRKISGSATGLSFPTDVRVDAAGTLYVADSGAKAILIFAPGASGNVAPTATVPFSTGSIVGLALSP